MQLSFVNENNALPDLLTFPFFRSFPSQKRGIGDTKDGGGINILEDPEALTIATIMQN
jgi:hypothetical protein